MDTTVSSFRDFYRFCYKRGIYQLWELKDKLHKLEQIEDEWQHHRDYYSYAASVNALKSVINDIENKEVSLWVSTQN